METDLWRRAEMLLPTRRIETYTQALMDLGAAVCTRRNFRCGDCPVRTGCVAFRTGRVDELPAPKPRKAVPQKEAAFLVLLRQGEVLLEKRPPAGIWGGLWCLPETPVGEDAAGYCAQRLGMETANIRLLAPFDHAFTHFKLRIHPKVMRVRRIAPRAEQSGRLWLSLEDALQAAVPAPVKKLLRALGEMV